MSDAAKEDVVRKLIRIFLDIPHDAFVNLTRAIERGACVTLAPFRDSAACAFPDAPPPGRSHPTPPPSIFLRFLLSADTGASPLTIWVTVIGFIFVVSFVYKKVSELSLASRVEIPLKDVAGHKDNVHVYIDLGISDRFKEQDLAKEHGRIEIELFSHKFPRTCENFRCFITGEKGEGAIKGKKMHYKGTKIHRIIPGFMMQGGDHIQGDGSGGESIYGRCFDDEWPEGGHVKHSKPGMLSMANGGPHTNGSQFFLTFAKAKWLDGRHVVFGQVVKGMKTVEWIEMRCGTYTGQPLQNVVIRDCGQLKSKSQ